MRRIGQATIAGLFFWSFAAVNAASAQGAKTPQPAQFESPDKTYNSMDGIENGGDSFSTGGPVLANAVLSATDKSSLYGLRLKLKLRVRDLGSFDIFVSNIAANGDFYSTRVIQTVSDRTLTRNFEIKTYGFGSTVPLAKNMRYYIGIRQHVGAKCNVILGNTSDPNVLKRREVKESGFFFRKGKQPNSAGPYEMLVAVR